MASYFENPFLRGLSDTQLRALNIDPVQVRQPDPATRPTLEFRKGIDDSPPMLRDADGAAYQQDPRSAAELVIRRDADGRPIHFDSTGGVRTPAPSRESPLLSGPGQSTPEGLGDAQGWPTTSPYQVEADRRIAGINSAFENRPSREVEDIAAKLKEQGRQRGVSQTHQQRFKNANSSGLAERNPDSVRETPAGQHPLDLEAARFASRNKIRTTTPTVPPPQAEGQGSRAQYYANRDKDPGAGVPQSASSQQRRAIAGDPEEHAQALAERDFAVEQAQVASADPAQQRAAYMKARKLNSLLPPGDQIPIPVNMAMPRPEAAAAAGMGPTEAGKELIRKSRERREMAETNVVENAMAKAHGRRSRMGLPSAYLSPNVRDLHVKADEAMAQRERMVNTAADREAAGRTSEWQMRRDMVREQADREDKRLAAEREDKWIMPWVQASRNLQQARSVAAQRPGDKNAEAAVAAAQADVDMIGQLMRRQGATPGQPAAPLAPPTPQSTPYNPASGTQPGGLGADPGGEAGPASPIQRTPIETKLWSAIDRHTKNSTDPDVVVAGIIKELGNETVRQNFPTVKAYLEDQVPGGGDALERAKEAEDTSRGVTNHPLARGPFSGKPRGSWSPDARRVEPENTWERALRGSKVIPPTLNPTPWLYDIIREMTQ